MKKKLFSIIGLLLVVVALLPSGTARATSKNVGTYFIDNHDGIHAYMSTMVHSNPAYNFAFSTMSPDRNQDYYLVLFPSGGSCVEAASNSQKNTGSSNYHFFGFVNICSGGFIWYMDLTNASNRSNYIRTYNWNDTGTAFNDDIVEVRIIETSANCFSGYIYNFNTATYDLKASACGNSGETKAYAGFIDAGGTQDSPNPYCPGLAPWQVIQIRGLQLRNGVGNWANVVSGDIFSYLNDTQYCINTTANYWRTYPAPQIGVKLKTAFTPY